MEGQEDSGVYGPSADPAEISELNKAAADEIRAKAELWRAIANVCNTWCSIVSSVKDGVLPTIIDEFKKRVNE